MSKPVSSDRLSDSLNNLKLQTDSPSKNVSRSSKNDAVADSWEDEEDDEENETADQASSLPSMPSKHKRNPSDYPSAPPPTPATLSPTIQSAQAQSYQGMDAAFDDVPIVPKSTRPASGSARRNDSAMSEDKRPEKSTAVASRLIAAGLGVKAPKRTEEQRAYDKAIREQERKRKEKEIQDRKKAEEHREKAKRSIWED